MRTFISLQLSSHVPFSTVLQRWPWAGQPSHLQVLSLPWGVIHRVRIPFPFLTSWEDAGLPAAPPWLDLNVQSVLVADFTPATLSLCCSHLSISLTSNLGWIRTGPRASLCLHYFLYFPGDESANPVGEWFFRTHSASFNSWVTNIDFDEWAPFHKGRKHLTLPLEPHKNIGLLLAPNMSLLQSSPKYSSHIDFYTKDDGRTYLTEKQAGQNERQMLIGQCDGTTSTALEI